MEQLYFPAGDVDWLRRRRSALRLCVDRLFFPLICLLSVKGARRLGLTPLDEERLRYSLRYARGRLLDVGCGDNLLVRAHGNGVGIDVVAWRNVDLVIKDCAHLPFQDASFDCVSFVASLNHIPERQEALREAFRVLKPRGRVIVTMIPDGLSRLAHRIRKAYDPDQTGRAMRPGEVWGMSRARVGALLRGAGFQDVRRKTFLFGLNSVYVGEKN